MDELIYKKCESRTGDGQERKRKYLSSHNRRSAAFIIRLCLEETKHGIAGKTVTEQLNTGRTPEDTPYEEIEPFKWL